jgi:cytochrome b subunit of formate dehydrogenase
VSRLWAKKHHSEWYKEISAGEKPADTGEEE